MVCSGGHAMSLSLGIKDRWRCCKKGCMKTVYLRKNTYLENSKISFSTIVLFIYSWVNEYTSIKFCEKELENDHSTTVDWNNYMRGCIIKQYIAPGTGFQLNI